MAHEDVHLPGGRGRVLLRVPVDFRTKGIVDAIPPTAWYPAIDTDDQLREGAWVAEATAPIDLSTT